MAEFLNPVPYLEELSEVFLKGVVSPDGLTFPPDLCIGFVAGLNDVAEKVGRLVSYVADEGCVRTVEAPAERPRTPVERRNLARLSAPLDPAGRVVTFPSAPTRLIAITEGGTAA